MELKPYIKTKWEDELVDIEPDDNGDEIILQEGTRYTASRANKVEEGIFNLHHFVRYLLEQIKEINIKLETIVKVPINNGSFYDPIDSSGTSRSMKMLNAMGVVQTNVASAGLEIKVDNGSLFKIGDNVTIFDDVSKEIKNITKVTGKILTVSATTNAYKKGAFIVRTNAVAKDNKLVFGTWGTYNVDVKEVM